MMTQDECNTIAKHIGTIIAAQRVGDVIEVGSQLVSLSVYMKDHCEGFSIVQVFSSVQEADDSYEKGDV